MHACTRVMVSLYAYTCARVLPCVRVLACFVYILRVLAHLSHVYPRVVRLTFENSNPARRISCPASAGSSCQNVLRIRAHWGFSKEKGRFQEEEKLALDTTSDDKHKGSLRPPLTGLTSADIGTQIPPAIFENF